VRAPVPPARTQAERDLERAQARIIDGAFATEARRRLIIELHEAGMTQPELAARLSRASRRAGGPEVSLASVEHVIRRSRTGPSRNGP
jgi:hypothetical protein